MYSRSSTLRTQSRRSCHLLRHTSWRRSLCASSSPSREPAEVNGPEKRKLQDVPPPKPNELRQRAIYAGSAACVSSGFGLLGYQHADVLIPMAADAVGGTLVLAGTALGVYMVRGSNGSNPALQEAKTNDKFELVSLNDELRHAAAAGLLRRSGVRVSLPACTA